MAKPLVHAKSSAKKFGGIAEDYIEIHQFMDSSKSAFSDNRHRALTHNSWFLFVLEKVFGLTITNSDGKEVSVRDIGEQHVVEDFGFIPTASDFLQEIEFKGWMNNGKGDPPPSIKKLERGPKKEFTNWKMPENKSRDIVIDSLNREHKPDLGNTVLDGARPQSSSFRRGKVYYD